LLSYPTFAFAASDPSIQALFDEAFSRAMPGLVHQVVEAGALWDMVKYVVASSFGAILLVFVLFSSWIGTRIGLKARAAYPESGFTDVPAADLASRDGAPVESMTTAQVPANQISLPPSLEGFSVPSPLVWALLASWAAILFNRFVPAPAFAAIAWNIAIALSICYGIQGFAVALALAGRVGLASAARLLAPITLILLMVSGTAGLVAIGAFAVLGTLETWIPFRTAHEGDITMKVILNHDVPNLGELGDVKDVAAGYARNFLLPRGLVYPYSPCNGAMFAKRKAEIEVRKAEKRASSQDLKTRLEAEELDLDMPAGQNGKLFGAVPMRQSPMNCSRQASASTGRRSMFPAASSRASATTRSPSACTRRKKQQSGW
jgi:ribosomal protein L9